MRRSILPLTLAKRAIENMEKTGFLSIKKDSYRLGEILAAHDAYKKHEESLKEAKIIFGE